MAARSSFAYTYIHLNVKQVEGMVFNQSTHTCIESGQNLKFEACVDRRCVVKMKGGKLARESRNFQDCLASEVEAIRR